MEMISGAFGSINWEVVAQLSMVGLIMVAGPVVIFVLAALRGNM
jgi:Photosystem II complex subunit Ycf12